ncbi:von Willebrand factor A [Streptomonospora alba]|uniref:von Willebrand factor A n=1 Tax=Streptomonospora alba TaxID=183763 RepID=A0A0C2JF81_9ACTN|nr:substrate-binding domain-containing protein [Streptomonospora alba]KIH99996.1 von Willebrand factor A [Streptomonospora alba]
MPNGRHRMPSRTRIALGSPLGIAAAVLVLIAVLSVAVPAALRYAGCGETRYLRIAAALRIAPLLQEAADEFNASGGEYGGVCVFAQAAEAPPHRVMTELSGGRVGGSTIAPDVWVPESSAWIELARISEAGARTIDTDPRSLAATPVVIAAPEDTEELPEPDSASWESLLPGERPGGERPLVMTDPNRGAPGMTAMHAVRRHLGGGDDADTAMTDFVRDAQPDTAFGEIDPAAIYPVPAGPSPLSVLPEQAVVEYNSSDPATPLQALYPEEGTVNLDYPFVATSDEPAMRDAAEDVWKILRTDPYRERLREMGFREPDGTASAALQDHPGIRTQRPETHGELTGDALLSSVEDWNRLSMPTRSLVLADVSRFMRADLDGGDTTRLEVTREAAQLGLSLFPDETELGLWLLSSTYGDSGREEVEGLARLGAADRGEGTTRRQELKDIAEGIEARGGGPQLYDNILSAYETVSSSYREDRINSVIVLTAGRDGGSSEISREELVAELQDSFDPERPVTLFVIAFGDQPDREALSDIADATSGTLSVADDPDEIGDIFLSLISRRLCVPDCGS